LSPVQLSPVQLTPAQLPPAQLPPALAGGIMNELFILALAKNPAALEFQPYLNI